MMHPAVAVATVGAPHNTTATAAAIAAAAAVCCFGFDGSFFANDEGPSQEYTN
jgi:hypothetical protein